MRSGLIPTFGLCAGFFLVGEKIRNLGDLRAKLPKLSLATIAAAPWIRVATF